MTWEDRAACAGMPLEAFYPRENERIWDARVAQAKKVCEGCPVKMDCLAWALEIDDRWGILGGYTATERRALRDGEPVGDQTDSVVLDRIRNGRPVTAPSTFERRRLTEMVMNDTPAHLIAQAFGIAVRTVETDKRILRAALGLVKGVDTARCGTETNYQAHRRLGEQACPPCCQAHAADVANRRAKRRSAMQSEAVA